MNPRVIHLVERTIAAVLARIGVQPRQRILMALSGGADSVALTHALHRLCDDAGGTRHELVAAHLNHRLRGAESDRDERFVRELCARLQIELFVEVVDGLANTSNLEERARDLRHAFLNRVADRIEARHIALAHHADDQAETVMMRLLRGSGAAGLGAMDTIGPGRIVRPMLTLRREQILAYLEAIGAVYVFDSTNLSPATLRNRVRHELLPMLERDYAPKLRRRLVGLASEMSSLDDYIGIEARRDLHRRLRSPARLDLAGFNEIHPAVANALLREWLRLRMGDLRRVYRADIERVRQLCALGAPGSIAELPRGWRLRCEYGAAVLEPQNAGEAAVIEVGDVARCGLDQAVRLEVDNAVRSELELSRDGVTEASDAGFTFVARALRAGDADCPSEPAIPRARRLEALFDADGIDGKLILRGFKAGDRIRPLGMTGTRKVHDVFVDRKLERARRATWPIIESQSEILWIPGMIRSRAALVTAATRNLLRLTAKPDAATADTSLLRN